MCLCLSLCTLEGLNFSLRYVRIFEWNKWFQLGKVALKRTMIDVIKIYETVTWLGIISSSRNLFTNVYSGRELVWQIFELAGLLASKLILLVFLGWSLDWAASIILLNFLCISDRRPTWHSTWMVRCTEPNLQGNMQDWTQWEFSFLGEIPTLTLPCSCTMG